MGLLVIAIGIFLPLHSLVHEHRVDLLGWIQSLTPTSSAWSLLDLLALHQELLLLLVGGQLGFGLVLRGIQVGGGDVI